MHKSVRLITTGNSDVTIMNIVQVWDLLVWSDGQSHAPVAVVAKLHYFGRLNVTQTVSNLARHCPEFWRSAEFRATLQGSNIMALDTAFFVKVLP